MDARLTADEIKATLGLEPHPTCGFVAETYRSPLKVPAEALPEAYDSGDRPYGSALYFLVSPDAQIVMHRIRSDELYHHYIGDPLEVLMLYPNMAAHIRAFARLAAPRALRALPDGTASSIVP